MFTSFIGWVFLSRSAGGVFLFQQHTCNFVYMLALSLSLSLSLSATYLVSAGVMASPVSSTVAEGSSVQFDFTVTGNPLPTVEWYKGTIGDNFRINLSPPQLESGESL